MKSLNLIFVITLLFLSFPRMGGAQSVQHSKIIGGDELYSADVVSEKGFKKLFVKATSAPQILGNLAFLYATNAGSNNLNVNGSVTPVAFTIPADATQDLVISALTFECFAGNIRTDRFLDLNSELTNGILVEVKSENTIFTFLSIKRTGELDSLFSVGDAGVFRIDASSSGTYVSAKFGPSSPFIIKKQGTYGTDDYIKVTIRDNLSSISRVRFIAFGAKD